MAKIDPEKFLDLAYRVAESTGRRANVDPGELLGAAWEGLAQAARSFDPAGGASFKTHASRRINGSIIDVLRAQSGWDRKNKRRRLAVVTFTDVARGLERGLQHAGGEIDAWDPPAPEKTDDVPAELELAVAALPYRDRELLALYYAEGFTLREIGELLGLSESRACQLHARALESLRRRLRPLSLSLSLSLKGDAMPIAETGAVSPPCDTCGKSFLADGWKRCKKCRSQRGGGKLWAD